MAEIKLLDAHEHVTEKFEQSHYVTLGGIDSPIGGLIQLYPLVIRITRSRWLAASARAEG